MLLWLIYRANGIVDERCCRLLDMIAKDVGYGFSLRETNYPLRACLKGREILHIEAPGIEAVSREKNSGIAVIYCDTNRVVTRNWDYVQHAATQVNVANVLWPVLDAVKVLRGLKLCGHKGNRHGRIFDRLYLCITSNMVRVRV